MTKKDTKSPSKKGGSAHDDPLAQIQQEEAKIQKKFSAKEDENREKLEKLAEKEEAKISEAEQAAKEKGNTQIAKAKEEASNNLKEKLGAAQRDVQSIAEKADSSKKEAIDLVVKSFESVIT